MINSIQDEIQAEHATFPYQRGNFDLAQKNTENMDILELKTD